MTNSPVSMCGVYSGRCLPRRMVAICTASRPTTWSVASITNQRRVTVAGLAMKLVMGTCLVPAPARTRSGRRGLRGAETCYLKCPAATVKGETTKTAVVSTTVSDASQKRAGGTLLRSVAKPRQAKVGGPLVTHHRVTERVEADAPDAEADVVGADGERVVVEAEA